MLTIENNDTGRNVYSVKSVNGEFMSSILHILPLIYSIFYLYGSRFTEVLNTDPIWIRIYTIDLNVPHVFR